MCLAVMRIELRTLSYSTAKSTYKPLCQIVLQLYLHFCVTIKQVSFILNIVSGARNELTCILAYHASRPRWISSNANMAG